MGRVLQRVERFFVWWLVFFIPTNLALHLFRDSATVYGVTVDYLIPKIYLSDIIIYALICLWFLRCHRNLCKWLRDQKFFSASYLLFYLLCATFVVAASQSRYPLAAYWFMAKIGQMSLLTLYLTDLNRAESKTESQSLGWLQWPLSLALLFQSLVAIVQWIQRKSLLGYLFLGETSLKTTSYVAKTAITGEIRPLPYGTTPHPNVLGGFLAIGLLIILLIDQLNLDARNLNKSATNRHRPKWLVLVTRVSFSTPIIIALLLTQSVSAVVVLIFGLIFLKFRQVHWRNAAAVLAILVAVGLAASPFVEATSVTRRIQLAEISLQMIEAEPWLGVGLNNFSGRMTEFGRVVSTTRFLQPVHNIYLLWLSEAGFVATGLILLLVWQRKSKVELNHPTYLIPFIALAVIGLADHYPLTLQTGQMLTALALGIGIKKW